MNEFCIGYIATGAGLGLLLVSFLYWLAGRNDTSKGVRRFGASAVICATVSVSSLLLGRFSWWLLLIYPFKILEYIQGYSNDSEYGWLKRLGISLTSTACFIFTCWVFGSGYWLLFIQLPVSFSSVLFSFKNPIKAPAEEMMVCFLNSFTLIFLPFR